MALHNGVRKVVVGGQQFELGMGHLRQKTIDAIVKIVVAYGGGIVLEHAHQLEFEFAPIEIKIGGPLKNIARIEQQGVGVFLSDRLHQGSPSSDPPEIGIP